jgi:hypothetical protein
MSKAAIPKNMTTILDFIEALAVFQYYTILAGFAHWRNMEAEVVSLELALMKSLLL